MHTRTCTDTHTCAHTHTWSTGALFDAGSLHEKVAVGWHASLELKRAVLFDLHSSRDWNAFLECLCTIIELLAKLHDVDTTLKISFTGRQKQERERERERE